MLRFLVRFWGMITNYSAQEKMSLRADRKYLIILSLIIGVSTVVVFEFVVTLDLAWKLLSFVLIAEVIEISEATLRKRALLRRERQEA